MNKFFQIIAFSCLCFLFSACGSGETLKPMAGNNAVITLSQSLSKSVTAELNQTKISQNLFKVTIILTNPDKKEIFSTRTWLAYNPKILKAVKILTENSDFDLAAPQENEIDETRGLIKIGRSKIGGQGVNRTNISVAEITFEKTSTGAAMLDFYNYHEDASGNTNANVKINGQIINVLNAPSSPGLVISL